MPGPFVPPRLDEIEPEQPRQRFTPPSLSEGEGATPSQPEPRGFLGRTADLIGQGAENTWETAKGFGRGLANIPVGAAKSFASMSELSPFATGGGQLQKAKEMFVDPVLEQHQKARQDVGAGNYASAAIRGTLGSVPVLGPSTIQRAEQIQDPKTRYGAIGETVGEALGGKALATANRSGLTSALIGGKKTTGEFLQGSSKRSYRDTMRNTSTKESVGRIADDTAEGLYKARPFAASQGDFIKQMGAAKRQYGPAAKQAYVGKAPITLYEATPIFKKLDQMEGRLVRVRDSSVSVNEPSLNALNQVRRDLRNMVDKQGNISAVALDDYRDKLFGGNVGGGGALRDANPKAKSSIETNTASSIRRVLDDIYPDATIKNDKFRTAANAERFLKKAKRAEQAAEANVATGKGIGFGKHIQRSIPKVATALTENTFGLSRTVPWNTAVGKGKAIVGDWLNPPVPKQPAARMANPATNVPPGPGRWAPGQAPPPPPAPVNTGPAQLYGPQVPPPPSRVFHMQGTPPPPDPSGINVTTGPPIQNPRRQLETPPIRMPAAPDTSGDASWTGPPAPVAWQKQLPAGTTNPKWQDQKTSIGDRRKSVERVPPGQTGLGPTGVVTEKTGDQSRVKGVSAKEEKTGRKPHYSSGEQTEPSKRKTPYKGKFGQKDKDRK